MIKTYSPYSISFSSIFRCCCFRFQFNRWRRSSGAVVSLYYFLTNSFATVRMSMIRSFGKVHKPFTHRQSINEIVNERDLRSWHEQRNKKRKKKNCKMNETIYVLSLYWIDEWKWRTDIKCFRCRLTRPILNCWNGNWLFHIGVRLSWNSTFDCELTMKRSGWVSVCDMGTAYGMCIFIFIHHYARRL